MIARSIAVLVALCMLGACSVGALDGFSGGAEGSDGGSDGGTGTTGTPTDGGSASDSASQAGDTGTATDPNGFTDTFESDSLCSPWTAYRATATGASPGRMDAASCKLCTSGSVNSGGMTRTVRPKAPATTLPAGEYLFTAWVRGAPYTGAIAFELYELTSTGSKGNYLKGTIAGTMLTGDWAALQVRYTAPAPVTGWYVDLYLHDMPPANSCFTVDDISATYTP